MAVFKCKVCGNIMEIPENATNVLCDSCQTVQSVVQTVETSGVQPLLERAFMFIEDGAWLRADEYLEKVLDQQPKNAEAYIGKLLLELRVKNKSELPDYPNPFDASNNYQKAFRFGDEETKKFLAETTEHIINRNETNRKEMIYNNAKNLFDNANSEMAFKNVANIFNTINDYKDAAALKEESIEKAEIMRKDTVLANAKVYMGRRSIQDQQTAISLFETIPGWKDADEHIPACKQNIEDIKVEIENSRKDAALLEAKHNMTQPSIPAQQKAIELLKSIPGWKDADEQIQICHNNIELINEKNELKKEELRRLEEEKKEASMKRKKKAKKIAIIVSVLVVLIAAAVAAFFLFAKPQIEYNKAVELLNAAQYDEARIAFTELGDFKDSAEMVKYTDYQKALSLLNQKKYDEAIELFESLGDYSDSKAQIDGIRKSFYENAERLLAEGKNKSAAMLFGKAIGYGDARERSFAIWDEIAVRETLSAGGDHTVGLKNNGTVIATKFKDSDTYLGQCDVSSWSDIVAVSAGYKFTAGLKKDGTVVVAGACEDTSGWKDIVAITAGYGFAAGLKADGTVVVTDKSIDVSEWSDICAISAGYFHLVGLKKDGTVVAAGNNNYGQCNGVESWKNIIAIETGAYHTVAKKNDHTVISTTIINAKDGMDEGQTKVGSWKNILAISSGNSHTVALTPYGKVICVGYNWSSTGTRIDEWENIVAVSAGDGHTVGLTKDGTVMVSGYNGNGQCEVDTWTDIKLPK